MSLLEQIQNEAVDSSSDLGSLLRKCKVLAARLGSSPLEEWLIWESNGYPDDVALPDYRIWSIQLKGHFSGPFGSGLRNAPIPAVCVPEDYRERFTQFHCRQSIAGIEELVKARDTNNLQVSVGDLAVVLGTRVYDGQNCVQAWGEFGAGALVEVLNTVRNRILDFVIAIWKVEPLAGEEQDDKRNLQPGQISQIFNTTVYGGSANLLGSALHSTVTFNVEANNFASLAAALEEHGVSEGDISELKDALDAEPSRPSPTSFGPRVATWISKMIQKAASGVWQIGVGAAGGLLSDAIGKYYGM